MRREADRQTNDTSVSMENGKIRHTVRGGYHSGSLLRTLVREMRGEFTAQQSFPAATENDDSEIRLRVCRRYKEGGSIQAHRKRNAHTG